MKKATVHIPFEEEKLAAVRLYMEQKELSFEDEMIGAAEALYGKHVPAQCTGIYRDARRAAEDLGKNESLPVLLLSWTQHRTVILIEKPEFRHRNRDDRAHEIGCRTDHRGAFRHGYLLCRRRL